MHLNPQHAMRADQEQQGPQEASFVYPMILQASEASQEWDWSKFGEGENANHMIATTETTTPLNKPHTEQHRSTWHPSSSTLFSQMNSSLWNMKPLESDAQQPELQQHSQTKQTSSVDTAASGGYQSFYRAKPGNAIPPTHRPPAPKRPLEKLLPKEAKAKLFKQADEDTQKQIVELMSSEKGDDGYTCLLCQKGFAYRQHLQTHVKTVHLRIKPFKCDKCPKSFGEKSALNKHKRAVHEKIRPFDCSVCGATFGQRAHLQKHQASKTGCFISKTNSPLASPETF